jgi:hypothetical protein
MTPSPSSRSPRAGGVLLALGAIVGSAVGLLSPLGPTRGFLIGIGLGVALSLALWLIDRRR